MATTEDEDFEQDSVVEERRGRRAASKKRVKQIDYDDESENEPENDEEDEFKMSDVSEAELDEEEDELDPEEEEDFELSPVKKKPAKKPAKKKTKTTGETKKRTKEPTVKETAPKKKAKSAKTEKKPTLVGGKAKETVSQYMLKANRPYSVINVFDNLHRSIAKPVLTKILDDLTQEEVLKCKTYGKSKIYFANQDEIPVPSEEELGKMKETIQEFDEESKQLANHLRKLEHQVSQLSCELTDEILDERLIELEQELTKLKERKAAVDTGKPPISPERKNKMKKTFSVLRSAWVKRKRTVMDAVDQMSEGMEKKPKELMELCGIETDQDVGVVEVPKL